MSGYIGLVCHSCTGKFKIGDVVSAVIMGESSWGTPIVRWTHESCTGDGK